MHRTQHTVSGAPSSQPHILSFLPTPSFGACRAKYPGSKAECGPALDLMKQDSVKAFAEAINKRPGSLDILVNNAGLGYTKKSFTEQGVGMLTQVGAAASLSCKCMAGF